MKNGSNDADGNILVYLGTIFCFLGDQLETANIHALFSLPVIFDDLRAIANALWISTDQ